jgi:hypothetical protein
MSSTLVSLIAIVNLGLVAWGLAELVRWLVIKMGLSSDQPA